MPFNWAYTDNFRFYRNLEYGLYWRSWIYWSIEKLWRTTFIGDVMKSISIEAV